MFTPRSMLVPAIAACCLGSIAVGQTTDGGAVLEPVDAGVSDISPLDAGMRAMQVDLRLPYGFDSVFRINGRDDYFVRGQGGVFAVFPQSVYAPTRDGSIPVIPYGTTFYIGQESLDALAPETMGPPSPNDDLRAGPRLLNPSESPVQDRSGGRELSGDMPLATPVRVIPRPPSAPTAAPPRIIDDPTYRRARLQELMQRAANAARGG